MSGCNRRPIRSLSGATLSGLLCQLPIDGHAFLGAQLQTLATRRVGGRKQLIGAPTQVATLDVALIPFLTWGLSIALEL